MKRKDKIYSEYWRSITHKIAMSFTGCELSKTAVSCVAAVTLLIAVPSTPAMALASSGFDSAAGASYSEVSETKTLTVTGLKDWEVIRDAVNKGEMLLHGGREDPPDSSEKEGGDWGPEAVFGDAVDTPPFSKYAGILLSGAGTYNFSGFTDNGDTVDNAYFTVSGSYGSTADMEISSTSVHMTNTVNNTVFGIKVQTTGTLA